jgi:hypothetical protein
MKKNKEGKRKSFDLVLCPSSMFTTDHKEGPYLIKSQSFKTAVLFNCLFSSSTIKSIW